MARANNVLLTLLLTIFFSLLSAGSRTVMSSVAVPSGTLAAFASPAPAMRAAAPIAAIPTSAGGAAAASSAVTSAAGMAVAAIAPPSAVASSSVTASTALSTVPGLKGRGGGEHDQGSQEDCSS